MRLAQKLPLCRYFYDNRERGFHVVLGSFEVSFA